ncbi:MAG: imidazolonepropionase [Thermoplasmata archaeon]|nr:imidazolonepropionase [Thermoplasmata archaeon]
MKLLIKNAGQLLTVASGGRPKKGAGMSDLGIIKDGAVVVEHGVIIDAGKTSDLKEGSYDEVIDAEGKVVMPGFVDAHTHLVFAGTREQEIALKIQGLSYMEILKRGLGILSTVRKTREAPLEQLVNTGKARALEMLALGTTTIEAKSGYGLEKQAEIKILEATKKVAAETGIDIIPTFLGAHAVPPEFTNARDRYVDEVVAMLPAVKSLAKFCDVFCERGVFEIEDARVILESARRHGFELKLHADEFTQLGGAELAASLKATSADHLLMASEKGLRAMADAGTIPVLLPATPLTSFLNAYPDARKMISMGLPVALATDLNPNAYCLSMQMVISLAVYNMRMLPAEAITASTVNAAFAVGLGEKVGSIEKGKQADILILDVENYEQIPYFVGRNNVVHVVKRGRIVV